VGAAQARAVVVGAVVVAVFFGLGLLVMSAALKFQPAAALPLALMTYVLQMAVVTLAFVVMDRTEVLGTSIDATWLTVTVAVLTVLFTAGLMWWGVRVRVPLYDLDAATPSRVSDEGVPGPVRDASKGWEASAR
jgi:ATP synthase protein I